MNLSHHKLEKLQELWDLSDEIGRDKFEPFQDAVFKICKGLHPGDTYNIVEKVKEANKSIFIKCVCHYIRLNAPKGDCNVEFSENYCIVKGIQTWNDQQREKQSQNNKKGGFYV